MDKIYIFDRKSSVHLFMEWLGSIYGVYIHRCTNVSRFTFNSTPNPLTVNKPQGKFVDVKNSRFRERRLHPMAGPKGPGAEACHDRPSLMYVCTWTRESSAPLFIALTPFAHAVHRYTTLYKILYKYIRIYIIFFSFPFSIKININHSIKY